ncbi:MAG: hypothetical protein JHC87_08665, partial [Thermoleophilaceae bacterium]|nr:hypothetical protein [Thermoleophilaceae bacterium]
TDLAAKVGYSDTNTFTVDTANPVVSIVAPLNGSLTGDNTPPVTFSVTEVNPGTSECRVDGGTWATCTSGSSLAALDDGSHSLQIRHTDAAGNVGSATIASFTVDTTPPTVSLTAPANGLATSDNTPQITFGVTEINLGTTECSVDGGTWATCTSGSSLATLDDGSHTFQVRHTDAGSNVGYSSLNTFTVDTVLPIVSLTVPAHSTITSDNTPQITFGVTEVNTGTSECSVDSASWAACSSGSSLATLADGGHTLQVRHTDAASNVATSSTNTFTVDTTNPLAPVITAPTTGAMTSDTTPTFSGTAEANSTVTVYEGLTVICTTTASGGGAWSCDASPAQSEGAHTYTAKAVDGVGNSGPASAGVDLTVDTTNPVVSLTVPADGSNTNDNTPLITFSVTEAHPSTTECIIDSGTWASCSSGSSLATLADGSHTLQVRHTDAAGNIGTSSTHTFTVDTVAPLAPVVTSPSPGAATADPTPTITGTAEDGSTVTVFIDGASVGTTTADGSGNWTFTPGTDLAEGVRAVTATATDAAGNTGPASTTLSLTVQTGLPVVTVTPGPVDNPATSPIFVISVSPIKATLTCSLDGAPMTACTSPYTPPTLEPGTHTLIVRAVDEFGNTTERTIIFVIGSDSQQCPSRAPTEGIPAKSKVLGVKLQNKKLRFDFSSDKFVLASIAVSKAGQSKPLGSSARASKAGKRSIFLRVSKFPKRSATLTVTLATVTEDGGRTQAMANLVVDAAGKLTLKALNDRNGGAIVGTPCGAASGAKAVKLVASSDTRVSGV